MNGSELTTNWLSCPCWPWASSEGGWSMVCQAQCRLQDERLSLVTPHSVQHHNILGETRTLAGSEKPMLTFVATGYTWLGWSFKEVSRA